MSKQQLYDKSPFLVDSDNGRICGIRHPDGYAEDLVLMNPVAGTPVDGVQATLTTNMSNANADIYLTAVNYGAEGNSINITYTNPSANSQALKVLVNGTAINVLLATNGSGTITSTAAQIVAALAAHSMAAALVSATYEGTGAGVTNAKTVESLSGGVTGTPGTAGATLILTSNGDLYRKATAQTWEHVATVRGTTGGLKRQIAEATATLSGSSTTITLSIPTGARLLGAQLRVDTLVTSAAATSWSAAFSGGSTTSLATGQAFTKNTKVNKLIVDEIASNTTNIDITPNTGTFTGGVVRAIVFYETLNTMANA